MSDTRQPITDKLVKDLALAAGKRKLIVYDAPTKLRDNYVPGFGVRITAGGSRVFVLRYRSAGMDRTMRIGPYGAWTVVAARDKAKALRRQVDEGNDPQRARAEGNAAPTLAETFVQFVRIHGPKLRESSLEGYKATFALHVSPALGKRKTAKIDHDDIRDLHAVVTQRSGPYVANRMVALLSLVFNQALRRTGGVNPAKGVARNQEVKRARYLKPEEVARLLAALAKLKHRQSADIFRLLLLTGARKGEVLSARWEQFDLKTGVWTKPGATTKQKTEHRVPLSEAARAVLAEIRARRSKGDWVFPGPGEEGHQEDVKNAWRSIRALADLPDVRIHDLRHSYASFLASGGASLPIIGALLGHTQPTTTARYVHLFDDPLKAATDGVGALLTGASPHRTKVKKKGAK